MMMMMMMMIGRLTLKSEVESDVTFRSTGCWLFVVWYPDINVYQESASYIFRVYTLVLPKCWYVHTTEHEMIPAGGVRV
jgi:hypothetical protein